MDLANLEVWRESEVNFPTDKFAKVRFLNDWYKEPKTRRPRRAYKERIGGVAATPPIRSLVRIQRGLGLLVMPSGICVTSNYK